MSVVLDVQPDTDYEPSEAEMIEYGKWLGMELPEDMPLLWIAREGLKAPLPENWKACKSEKGELYYFNFKTGQSIWDHPSDEHYRELLSTEKAKLKGKVAEKDAKAQSEPEVSPSKKGEKGSKKKKAKANDTESPKAKTTPQEEKKAVAVVQQLQPAILTPTAQPKKENSGPIKLASLSAEVAKSEKKGAAQMNFPEFQSTTSQSDSSLVSEPPKNQKVDEPDAIPLPTKVVAGGGVNGLRALDKLVGNPPSPSSSAAAMKAAAVSFAKEQKEKADQQAAKELEVYKTERQKALQSKVDEQLAADLEAYRAEQKKQLRAKADGEVAKELETYKVEQQKSLARQKKEIDDELAADLAQHERRASDEKAKRRGSDEKEAEAALAAETAQLKSDLEKRLSSLRQEFEAKRAAESERLREKLKAQLDHDKRKAEAEIAQMLEAFTREKRQESEIKKEAQSQALQEAGNDVSDVKQCAVSFLHQYEDALSKFAQAVQESKAVFDQIGAQKQKELESSLEKKLKELSQQHDEAVAAAREKMKAELDGLHAAHMSTVESTKASHEQELERLRSKFDEQRNQCQKDQIAQEHDRFMETIAEIKAAQAKELEALKQQLKEKAQEELSNAMSELSRGKEARRSSSTAVRLSDSHESRLQAVKTPSLAVSDDDERSPKDKSSPPKLNQKLLAHPLQEESPAESPSVHSTYDIKVLLTEALREVFAGSPFILPSPGQAADTQSMPETPTASASPLVARSAPEFRPAAAQSSQPLPSSGSGGRPVNGVNFPLSFQEQRNLVEGERRRLQEGRRYVDAQQQNLEERRQQLKRTRHQWKQDVLAAKAEGVRSSSKRGQLLNKVRLSLEEQARGLEHDMLILRDSQVWLLSKEQRLLALEQQIEEQERSRARAGGDGSTFNNMSVDTAAFMTGYFKPQRHTTALLDVPVYRDAMRRGSLGSGSLPIDSYASSPVLSKALNRIERRLDEVTSIIHQQQQQHQHRASSRPVETSPTHGSRRHSAVSPVLRDATQGRARRSSHSLSRPEILRRETHLDQWQGPSM